MAFHKRFFDDPEMQQVFYLFGNYHLTLAVTNEVTESILLELISAEYLKKHFRDTIKKIAPDKFSDSEVDLLVGITFYMPEIDIFELDMVQAVLTDKECALLRAELYQISECDVIVDFLVEPHLSAQKTELLIKYFMEMRNNLELNWIEDTVCEKISTQLYNQMNGFVKSHFYSSVIHSLETKGEGDDYA